MSKKLATILAISTVFLLLTIASAMAYEAFHGPTEVTYYDPTKAYNGITTFMQISANPGICYMIDMDGRLIHKIKSPPPTGPISLSWFVIPLDNGNFLRLWGPLNTGATIDEINLVGQCCMDLQPASHYCL